MKLTTRCCTLALVLLVPLAGGCSKETTEAASKTADSAGQDMKQLGNKAMDQLAALKASSEKHLASAEKSMDELEAKASTKTAEAKKDLEDLMKQIEAKKDELEKAMADTDWKAASADAYNAAKAKIDKLGTELSQLVEKAKAKTK